MSDAQNPETYQANLAKLRHRAKYALREGGIDIPSERLLDAVVAMLVDERTEVRHFSAAFLETVVGSSKYEHFTHEQLEQLAYVIQYGFVDDDDEIRISFPDSEPR
jgi:hypothetical protein